MRNRSGDMYVVQEEGKGVPGDNNTLEHILRRVP